MHKVESLYFAVINSKVKNVKNIDVEIHYLQIRDTNIDGSVCIT